jgi:hypothetical protein
MSTTLLALSMTLLLAADPGKSSETPRKPNPLAPSLNELTEEEEDKLDEIIDRFIDFDSGKLRGTEGKEAQKAFLKLGQDAIPALIRGLNKAAKIDHSCPAVTIAKRLSRMLSASKDPELLQFARENIGAGVTRSKHMGVLKDLRVTCMLRKSALEKAGIETAWTPELLKASAASRDSTDPAQKKLKGMSDAELVEAAGKERGAKLKLVLTELGRRRGDAAIGALGAAATTYEGDIQKLAREQLSKLLSNLSTATLKDKFTDDRAEVRAAAARVAASKGLHLESQLIDLLKDEEKVVRQAAHDALVKLNKGIDYGPKAGASPEERKEAEQKWRAWLTKQNGR